MNEFCLQNQFQACVSNNSLSSLFEFSSLCTAVQLCVKYTSVYTALYVCLGREMKLSYGMYICKIVKKFYGAIKGIYE